MAWEGEEAGRRVTALIEHMNGRRTFCRSVLRPSVTMQLPNSVDLVKLFTRMNCGSFTPVLLQSTVWVCSS
jgi:hypothetical protein